MSYITINNDDDNNDPSANITMIYNEATHLATLAVSFDQQKDLGAAIYYYSEAIVALKKYLQYSGSHTPEISKKLNDYESRVEILRSKHANQLASISNNVPKPDESNCSIERLEFLLNEALDEDDDNNVDVALESYLEAVETGLELKKTITNEQMKERLTFLITKSLERAEMLKGVKHKPQTSSQSSSSIESKFKSGLNLNDNRQTNSASSNSISAISHSHIVTGQDSYTKEEIAVMKRSSNINGIDYLPFLAQIDLRERFSTLLPYCDPRGVLPLSDKQKAALVSFRRLSEIAENPCIIQNSKQIDCFSIKQTLITDCSFIASLTVSALYERRFSKKLVSNIIYPQNRAGEPVYNPCGKYMIKFNLNGILRKIIIDDRLPVGQYGQLLCSYSSNSSEFWVSLLEKAYMKVMGGYDFPGSNSNIDLHALTGWIPERISLEKSEKEKIFRMILDRYSRGDLLVTFATGEFSDSQSERSGLVSAHAYAMLDLKFVQNHRLFLLKNPWSHVRWKGKFSERDTDSWTTELQRALQFDPKSAANFDNGVFWIDIDSLFHFFDVCYLSWNPSLFKYTFSTHDVWNAGLGPAKDQYYVGDNPQYSLSIKNPDSSTWILLTRHIMDRNDFANNREYIALLVYKNDGEKVYIPFDPKPYIDGARINSPHYLCKLVVNKDNPVLRYTLVISQYEKSNTILYTLKAYSTSPFVMKKLINPYRFKETDKKGSWNKDSAGGCRNHPATYQLNPVYNLTFSGSSRDEDNEVMIELRGPKDYGIGVEITSVTLVNQNSLNSFRRKDSGSFRNGFTYLKIKSIPAGTYQIVPSTYLPGQLGPYFLTVNATHSIKLTRIK